MDEERRDEKARKEYYNMIDYVAYAQQSIRKLCPCGSITKPIVDEDDTYDYLPRKRYWICKDFENDGLHFRQPWVHGIQEEVESFKERFAEQEKLLKECQALKDQVRLLLMRVAQLERASLASQGCVDLDSSEPLLFSSQGSDESLVKERRKWSAKEDVILIGAWLNTSKDPIVSNEQKASAFWKRIVEYYKSNPQLVGTAPRELGQCKQRWARINDMVCKFAGCYAMALREQSSGQNDNDVMSAALQIFSNDHKTKFNLEHCCRELRHDVKWCATYMEKDTCKEKRKTAEFVECEGPEREERPIGVNAAKVGKRKKSGKDEELAKLEGLLEIKKQISKQSLLESLVAKSEPLSQMELALKMKLMSEML